MTTTRKVPYQNRYILPASIVGGILLFICLFSGFAYFLIPALSDLQDLWIKVMILAMFGLVLGAFAFLAFKNLIGESVQETYRKMLVQAPGSTSAKIVSCVQYQDEERDVHRELQIRYEALNEDQSTTSIEVRFSIDQKTFDALKDQDHVEVRYCRLDPSIVLLYPYEWSKSLDSG